VAEIFTPLLRARPSLIKKKKKGSKKYKKTRSRPSDEQKDKRQVMREREKKT
jgi:hypothetical protein